MRWIGANDLALGVFIAIIVTAVALALLERWGVKNKWLRWPVALVVGLGIAVLFFWRVF